MSRCAFAAVLLLSSGVLFAGSPASSVGCRVTGIVTHTKAETRLQPAENQFRLRVLDSPWDWQVGVSIPVTSAEPVTFGEGDLVEVDCDFKKVTRKGRLFGLARRVMAPLTGGGVPPVTD